MNAFEEKTLRYIHRHMPAVANGKILTAVSGGADSVALLRVLAALGCNCIAAHCNFHLRGDEADRDEAFVRKLCHDIDIELRCTDFDVEAYKKSHGVSTEMACRELRYEWFERQRAALGCSVIAVAHHRDDNIETFFLNLVRGSGITGLAGIKPCNGKIVRPLLGSSRDEIINYLKTLGQDYVTDSTNLENDYARNKIRNVLLPEISRLFPSALAGIELTLDNLQGDYAVWSGAVEAFKRDAVEDCGHGQIKIDRRKLAASADPATLLNALLSRYGFNGEQTKAIASASRVGAVFESKEYVAEVGRNDISVFSPGSFNNADTYNLSEAGRIEKETGIHVEIVNNTPDFKFDRSGNTAYFDADAAGLHITVRHWRQGDRFSPFGMKGTKKLSDYFNDRKFSLMQKLSTPIVEMQGRIVWIAGERAADDFRVTPSSRRILTMRVADKT